MLVEGGLFASSTSCRSRGRVLVPGYTDQRTSRPQSSHSSAGSNGGTTTFKIGIRPTALRRTPGVINTAPAGILAMVRVARKRGG